MVLSHHFRGNEVRDFLITKEGDEVQLQLFENQEQIGGAVFPEDGGGAAFYLAQEVAMAWVAVPRVPKHLH